jgi:hypothetical protein
MDEGLELVVVIPTSPSSSKTKSGCKSYGRFRVAVFLDEKFGPRSGRAGLWAGKSGPRPEKSGGPPNHTTGVIFGDRQTVRRTVRPEVRRRWTYGQTLARFAPNGQIFLTYKYPSSSLNQRHFWASLSSIVDLQSLPSLLHSLHVSCIFLREKREEI